MWSQLLLHSLDNLPVIWTAAGVILGRSVRKADRNKGSFACSSPSLAPSPSPPATDAVFYTINLDDKKGGEEGEGGKINEKLKMKRREGGVEEAGGGKKRQQGWK